MRSNRAGSITQAGSDTESQEDWREDHRQPEGDVLEGEYIPKDHGWAYERKGFFIDIYV